jgi:RNA polymerase sigma factor (sigma-70 family)
MRDFSDAIAMVPPLSHSSDFVGHLIDRTKGRNVTRDERNWLAERFEEHRPHLRAVSYRMLGSFAEADDAVQEAWLRLSRSDAGAIENLGGWLTTVVARVCLNVLESRRSRREEPLDVHVPDPIVTVDGAESDPEHEALLADSVGLALLVVLDTLTPAERLAFVLHDMFAVPFDDIAPIVGRSPEAARQLASRARRRVQGADPVSDVDVDRQREVVNAFLAAAREGDFDALLALLDPDVVLRADSGASRGMPSHVVRGARAVAEQAFAFRELAHAARPALVNGAVGIVSAPGGKLFSVGGLTIKNGRIVEMDILADPERLARLDIALA